MDANNLVAVVSAMVTGLAGIGVAWVGYQSKGRDRAQAIQVQTYDNLQEDLAAARAEIATRREEAEQLRARGAQLEEELTQLRKTTWEVVAFCQERAHDLRTIIRGLLSRIEGHPEINTDDLRAKLREVESRPKPKVL